MDEQPALVRQSLVVGLGGVRSGEPVAHSFRIEQHRGDSRLRRKAAEGLNLGLDLGVDGQIGRIR